MTNKRTFHPKAPDTRFIVKNVAPNNKTVRVFNTPIRNKATYDLLHIPEISEAIIRHSLMKGELRYKFLCGELVVTDSDIDLLQFNDSHKSFLQSIGITKGLEVEGTGSARAFLHKVGISLLGDKDNSNRIFTAPDIFINEDVSGDVLTISIFHDGNRLVETEEYFLSESGGTGTGYDTIVITAFKPKPKSTLIANYFTDIP
jgi:hypothetical protein